MSKFNRINHEAINGPDHRIVRSMLRKFGRAATRTASDRPVPPRGREAEALSYLDATAPKLPLTDELDRLDAIADEELIAAKMSHIEIRKPEDQ